MSHSFVYGADYHLGYGFDGKTGYVFPFKCELLELKSSKFNNWTFMDNQDYYKQIWNQNYLKVLENRLNIEGDEEEYHNICIQKYNGNEECQRYEKYPENFDSFIYHRSYGFSANIIVNKHGIPYEHFETGSFLVAVIQNNCQLSREQEGLTCYVVINGREKHEWSLTEFVDFCRNHGDDEKYQGTLTILVKNLLSSVRMPYSDKLMEFLEYLYLCYRKVEVTFAKQEGFKEYQFGYSTAGIFNENNMISILRASMEDYRKDFKNSDRITSYTSMKKLFHAYKNYLEYCVLHGINTKVNYNVEGDINMLQNLWKILTFSTLVPKSNEQQKNDEMKILENVKCEKLQRFLRMLQLYIDKIEIHMDKVGYPKLEVEDKVILKDNMRLVAAELEKSIEEYQNLSNASFLDMYSTSKKLYLSYLNYIDFCTRHNLSIDEEIPGTIEELNLLSKFLDSWSLTKINNEWCGSDETLLLIKENDADLNPISKKIKDKGIRVVTNQNLEDDESFRIKHPEIDSAVGLVQLKTCPLPENINDNNLFETKCPSEECPDIQRKWMCTNCCRLLRIIHVSCGCQNYHLEHLDFICPSKKHPEVTEEEPDEGSVSDVSSKDEKIKELTMRLKELKNIQNQQILENINKC